MTRRLLTILAVVAAAALAYLWPLETALGMVALIVGAFVLVAAAAAGFSLGQKAEQEARLQEQQRQKWPMTEAEAYAAVCAALDRMDQDARARIVAIAQDRYIAQPHREAQRRERLLALTVNARPQ